MQTWIKSIEAPARRAPRKISRLNDARSLRSQEMLRNALLRLIETRLFTEITLRDITNEAGVSYPTFFKHYDNKDHLFLDIAREEILALISAFRKGLGSPTWRPGAGMCEYVSERQGLWRTLLTAGASEAMRSEYIRLGRNFEHQMHNLGHGFPIDVISGVIASGTFEIFAWWLGQDADYSCEAIANMLETLVIEPALNLPRGYFTDRKASSGSSG